MLLSDDLADGIDVALYRFVGVALLFGPVLNLIDPRTDHVTHLLASKLLPCVLLIELVRERGNLSFQLACVHDISGHFCLVVLHHARELLVYFLRQGLDLPFKVLLCGS